MLPVSVDTVCRSAEIDGLRPEWEGLWTKSSTATPFQSPAWLLPWWRHLGGGDPQILTVRHGRELIGVLPLFVHREPPLRIVLPLGISFSDRLDGLFADGYGAAAASAMLAHLVRHAGGWDICRFTDLPPRSPLLEAAVPPGWSDARMQGEVSPVLALAGATALRDAVPRSLVDRLDRYRRRAGKLGPVRFETADAATFDTLFDALLTLHGARWASRGQAGVMAHQSVRRFHRDAAAGLLAAGMLRLHALRIGDRIAACLYGFAAKHRTYGYLSGFDPALAPLGPGTLLIGHAIEQAIREGAEAFDFLRGREAYKYCWGAEDHPSHVRTLRRADGRSTVNRRPGR